MLGEDYPTNSLDRSLDWKCLMENRRLAHLRRVDRKGRCTEDSFEIGEKVRIQNMQSKLWDTEGVITGTRIASDGRIVSYDLNINGNHSTRHRKFIQKCNLPNVREDDTVEGNFSDESEHFSVSSGGETGGTEHCADRELCRESRAGTVNQAITKATVLGWAWKVTQDGNFRLFLRVCVICIFYSCFTCVLHSNYLIFHTWIIGLL